MGFVGSHLTEFLLKKNHEIKIITKSFLKKQNVEKFKKIFRLRNVV